MFYFKDFDDLTQSVGNRLTANNVGFYFDYQNGEYGFNTSANRGADTFSPFSSGVDINILDGQISYSSGNNSGGYLTAEIPKSLSAGLMYIICWTFNNASIIRPGGSYKSIQVFTYNGAGKYGFGLIESIQFNANITNTSIRCTGYSGSWFNLYVTIFRFKDIEKYVYF